MGEQVDEKGRIRYFCEICGALTRNSFHCVACEPPDTVKDPGGARWWGYPRRGLLARRHLTGIAFTPEPPKRGRGRPPNPDTEHMPSREEGVFLHAMIDAVREMLGMDPLYGQKKKATTINAVETYPHFYDEGEGEWKK